MSNKNQNYLKEFLINQLTEVKIKIYKLESEENKYGLEQPQWQINGFFDGLVFRKEWIEMQLEELSK